MNSCFMCRRRKMIINEPRSMCRRSRMTMNSCSMCRIRKMITNESFLSSPVAQCVAQRAPMQQCVWWLVRAPSSS